MHTTRPAGPKPADGPSLWDVLCSIVRDPIDQLIRRWNWKSAVTSSLVRAAIFFFVNLAHSLVAGKRVGRNPWHAGSLEWEAPSPPGHGNFDKQLIVYRGPYEYGTPEVAEDYLPQARQV